MSRKLTAPMALLCALTLLFTGTASASDFFFPSVSALKGTPVPSYASLMRVQPVSEKFVGENLVQVYEKVSEDLYFAFGEALSASERFIPRIRSAALFMLMMFPSLLRRTRPSRI